MLLQSALLFFCLTLFSVYPASHIFAASPPAVSTTGLETGSLTVPLRIEFLSGGAPLLGLSEDRIRTKMELRFRQVGLSPAQFAQGQHNLLVAVTLDSESYSVHLYFQRPIEFTDVLGRRFIAANGMTWARETLGWHNGKGETIVQALDEMMDAFLNDYLKANPK